MSKNYKYRKWFTFEGRQYSVRGDTLDEVYEKKAKKLQELKETGQIVSGARYPAKGLGDSVHRNVQGESEGNNTTEIYIAYPSLHSGRDRRSSLEKDKKTAEH